MTDKVALLRNVAIFRDLDDAELAEVAEVSREEEFVSGEFIFREGESGNRLYLIVEGDVRISRDVPGSGEEALAILKTGAVFGEMAVFDRSERSTHAISNGGTRVLTITRPDFEMLLDFNREIAYKVLWSVTRLLSGRLRSTNDSAVVPRDVDVLGWSRWPGPRFSRASSELRLSDRTPPLVPSGSTILSTIAARSS